MGDWPAKPALKGLAYYPGCPPEAARPGKAAEAAKGQWAFLLNDQPDAAPGVFGIWNEVQILIRPGQ